MARRKLSKTQKAKNKAKYKNIRKEYNKIKSNKYNISYIGFKQRVLGRAERDNISIKAAAKKEARTETFWNAADRSRDNLIEAIRTKHNEAYSELKNLSRYEGETVRDNEGNIIKRKGQFQAIKENLTWDKDKRGYILTAGNKQYFIDVSNSPEEVNITEIN